MHPQTVPGEPARLRWIVPAGALPCAGPMAAVPAPLEALLADGTLSRIAVEPSAVVTDLAEGRSWSREGARVRSALHAALDDPAGWTPAADGDGSYADTAACAAARDVLAGPVGDFARSHGGTIDLVDVRDGVVTVRLGGACHGCPAAWFTLHNRLERELLRRLPGPLEIRSIGTPGFPAPAGLRRGGADTGVRH
ncbi:NifU family protein [Streptomyces sp. NPDC020996]|uniref:NifU family protein n=1 Tax=Streptomyces sp. NPDC020996 TaxID=3154791 RepID=UPI00341079C8